LVDRESGVGLVPTLTHARLRAEQGDVETARRLLEAILAERPDCSEARSLLDGLSGVSAAPCREAQDEVPPPPEPAGAEDLATRFRAVLEPGTRGVDGRVRWRLEELLKRIDEGRGERRAR